MEINTRIHRVPTQGADLNPRAGHTTLREEVNSTRVSLHAFVSNSLCHLICLWCSHPLAGACICS
jgi:hypothetical protein